MITSSNTNSNKAYTNYFFLTLLEYLFVDDRRFLVKDYNHIIKISNKIPSQALEARKESHFQPEDREQISSYWCLTQDSTTRVLKSSFTLGSGTWNLL